MDIEKTINSCKWCHKIIKDDLQKCCIFRRILNNFTGEFDSWSSIEHDLKEEFAKQHNIVFSKGISVGK